MTQFHAMFLTCTAGLLVALVAIPDGWVKSLAIAMRRAVTLITAIQFIAAASFVMALVSGWASQTHIVLIESLSGWPLDITIYFDGVSGLMLALISFVGWVTCQYSVRYLDGEPTQGRYFRWASFTIGAVSLMAISGNLLMFIGGWVMTSLGLHQLLLHYGHRAVARRAAWTKFTVSRLGDLALFSAAAIVYLEFDTLDFAELLNLASSLPSANTAMQVAGFLLVLGAATKSAQVPFHTWLPLTLETPTPVSALMHAGIVNAGGYLMIRISPLVALSPWALTTLAIIGGVTAIYAAVVMATQTSVKKVLAYSTIAQMGFMLLQCGLGAFSAAMLHILAHSLYKAYAFLSSGSVITERATTRGALPLDYRPKWIELALACVLVLVFLGTSFKIMGIHPTTKPGGLLLGGVMCLALTHWVVQVMRTGNQAILIRAVIISFALCLMYSASFVAIDRILSPSLPSASSQEMFWLFAGLVLLGFIGLLCLRAILDDGHRAALLNRWRIHASNGFYLESTFRRVFGQLLNN